MQLTVQHSVLVCNILELIMLRDEIIAYLRNFTYFLNCREELCNSDRQLVPKIAEPHLQSCSFEPVSDLINKLNVHGLMFIHVIVVLSSSTWQLLMFQQIVLYEIKVGLVQIYNCLNVLF